MPAGTTSAWARYGPWFSLVSRLLVGGVWIWAGIVKMPHPEASVTAVRAYQLLPPGMADAVGRFLPTLEVLVGVLLVLGALTRIAGGVSALLQVAFVVGIASVWFRGIAIDCGCFGAGGEIPWEEASAKYPWEIARDLGLMLLSLYLVWRPRTPFSVDNLLFSKERDVEAEA